MNLLLRLNDLQARDGWLSPDALRVLSEEANVPLYRLQEVASFYPHYRLAPPPEATVRVCRDAACHLAGGKDYLRAVKAAVGGADGVVVEEVSCLGRCEHAPAASVEDVPLEGYAAEAVAAVARGEAPLPPDEPTARRRRWPSDPYARDEDHYGVLERLLADSEAARRDVPGVLEQANLRGMGGAGFPTGLKWRLVRDAPGEDKVAIVNADESEPGTFKDRVILEELPHLVVEGLLLGCLVAGARTAVIYLRHEYGREGKAVAREIERARGRGLLDRLGVDLSVFVSPGGYILGEETALIEALEGKRGEPRNKPPFPGQHGVDGRPTLVNNVETYAYVPQILTEGGRAWRAHGVRGGSGWKFLSLCGHVERPGVYCVPMGTTVRELLEEHGGGMKGGLAPKAFSPGGASAPFLPASLLDTPLDFQPMTEAGSMLGSGAVLVVAEGTDMLDLGLNVTRFFRNESCGKCVPCRIGTEKAVVLLQRLLEGRRKDGDLRDLHDLEETLKLTSICGLGQAALGPALSVFRHFPEDADRGS